MAVYTDLGVSEGMAIAVGIAEKLKKRIEFRTI